MDSASRYSQNIPENILSQSDPKASKLNKASQSTAKLSARTSDISKNTLIGKQVDKSFEELLEELPNVPSNAFSKEKTPNWQDAFTHKTIDSLRTYAKGKDINFNKLEEKLKEEVQSFDESATTEELDSLLANELNPPPEQSLEWLTLEELLNQIQVAPPESEAANESPFNLLLTEEDFNKMCEFYQSAKDLYEALGEDTRVAASESNLPYSMQYIANGERQGMHILLKERGGHKKIGQGSTNSVCLAYHIDNRELECMRSTKKELVSEREIETNQKLADDKRFAAGTPFFYRGNWTAKIGRATREDDVEKVGVIMDIASGGNLFQYMQESETGIDDKKTVSIAIDIAEAVAALHNEYGLIHCDLKPENILLTEDGKVMICDFEATTPNGEDPQAMTTIQYCPPEGLLASASPSYDVWSLGCVLMDLFYGSSWFDNVNSRTVNLRDEFDVIAKKCEIMGFDTSHPVTQAIDRCLEVDPSNRISMNEIVELLKSHEKNLT